MSLHIVFALVALVLVLLGLFVSWRLVSRRVRRRPRRRDLRPQHLQARAMYAAFYKRCRRGFRFPTVWEKKEHKARLSRVNKVLADFQKKHPGVLQNAPV